MSAEGSAAGYRIRLADGGPEFTCMPGDTVLRAALRSGIGLPYECSSGGCGACRVQLKEGELENLWPEAPGLAVRSRDRGFRLACQSRPHSDCMISIRVPLRTGLEQRPRQRSAELVSKQELTHDITEFTFSTPNPAEFLSGQYALLSLPGVTGDRAYSMSNLPNEEGLWHFVIKRMTQGAGGRALFDELSIGDRVTLDGPYGLSYLRADSPRDIVCIAGGSGLSPILSILLAAANSAPRERRIHLFYGGRRPADLAAAAIVESDPLLRERVSCIKVISDTACTDAWDGERGFVHEVARRHLEKEAVDPASMDYYFCGPPAMADAVQGMLFDLKVPVSQMFYDRFV